MDDKLYSMHITFADGSNPWVRFNMTRAEYGYEVNRWIKNYDLRHLREDHGVHYFLATQRKSFRARERRINHGDQGSSF